MLNKATAAEAALDAALQCIGVVIARQDAMRLELIALRSEAATKGLPL